MHRDYFSSGAVGAALIVSIIVAWLAILVPSHAAPSLGANAAEGIDSAVSIVSNAARKGDRLDVARSRSEPAGRSRTRIPVGCDVASVRSQHIAVRCITSAETVVKLARASDPYLAL